MEMSLTRTVGCHNEKHNSQWMPTLCEAISLNCSKSCTVWDFSRSLYECSIWILTVCVWKLAHVWAPMLRGWVCRESPETSRVFCLCNYLTHKCSMCQMIWKPSIGRRKVGVWRLRLQMAPLCSSILRLWALNNTQKILIVKPRRVLVWSRSS